MSPAVVVFVVWFGIVLLGAIAAIAHPPAFAVTDARHAQPVTLRRLVVHSARLVDKDLVHRGHPPTTLGTWPSGGMARVMVVYGLVIFFVVLRYAPARARAWAIGGSVLMLAESVQGYARLDNLEH